MNQEINSKNALYYKKWLEANQDRMKETRRKWYQIHKDNEEYKQKRKEYNKLYYQQKKNKNTGIN